MRRYIVLGLFVFCLLQPLLAAETAVRPDAKVSLEKNIPEKIRDALPSVVNVQTDRSIRLKPGKVEGFLNRYFTDFFEQKAPEPISFRTTAEGSGVILTSSGLVLTNAHVVQDAQHIRVVLGDQREFNARLLGRDKREDLALLQVLAAPELPAVLLGDSSAAAPADEVYAIGSPLGYRQTITKGIVSAVDRQLKEGNKVIFDDLIQTDVPLNPGNSGGPLLNSEGEMIGLVNSGYPGARGIGFAIPANRIKGKIDELKADEPYLKALAEFQNRFGFVPETKTSEDGSGTELVLGSILPGSPAAKAGLREGDLLLRFHIWSYGEVDSLLEAASELKTGDRIYVLIRRLGRPFFTYLEVES